MVAQAECGSQDLLSHRHSHTRKFIEKGSKVKVSMRFRGREIAHTEGSMHVLTDFAKELEDIAVIEKAPKMEGRTMSMFLTEKK